VDKYLAKCAEYRIDTTDLYHDEDQPGDAWYLVGDWKPVGFMWGSIRLIPHSVPPHS